MDLTYTSPIRHNFIPKIGSTITFELKLNASKSRIKVNVEVNIFYKDPLVIGRVSLANSGAQSIYTSKEDTFHKLKFKIPEFKELTQSYISVSMEPSDSFYDKVAVEDMKVIEDAKIIEIKIPVEIKEPQKVTNVAYSHPNMAISVPSLGPKIGSIQEIKEIVTKGYRDILKREADPVGLESYIEQLKNGLSTASFHDILRSSQEYRDRFRTQVVIPQSTQKTIDTFKEGQKVAIASIVRDEENSGNLGRFLDCCQELEQYHKNLIYIFIEGDSSDRTYDVLKDWTGQRTGSILEKINKGYSPFGKTKDAKRTAHLAELRNRLIELILSIQDVGEVLMIDANYGWKGDLISSLREANSHIAAPLVVMHKDASGKYMFYDIWVFRKNGREFWPLYPYAEGMQFDNPTDVDSVGSGYLIKRQVLEGGVRYDGNNDSEQVGFCNNARNQGFSIKINPKIYIKKGGFKE